MFLLFLSDLKALSPTIPSGALDESPPEPEGLAPVPPVSPETLRAECDSLIDALALKMGFEFARRTLLDHGGARLRDVPDDRVAELRQYLRQALKR